MSSCLSVFPGSVLCAQVRAVAMLNFQKLTRISQGSCVRRISFGDLLNIPHSSLIFPPGFVSTKSVCLSVGWEEDSKPRTIITPSVVHTVAYSRYTRDIKEEWPGNQRLEGVKERLFSCVQLPFQQALFSSYPLLFQQRLFSSVQLPYQQTFSSFRLLFKQRLFSSIPIYSFGGYCLGGYCLGRGHCPEAIYLWHGDWLLQSSVVIIVFDHC